MTFLEHLKAAIKEKGWLLFNAFGLAIYLAIESWIWAPRIPEDAFNGIDQICFWETQEFPLLAFYFGVNVTWLLMSRENPLFRTRQLFMGFLASLLWGIVVICDPIAIKIIVLVIPMMIERAGKQN